VRPWSGTPVPRPLMGQRDLATARESPVDRLPCRACRTRSHRGPAPGTTVRPGAFWFRARPVPWAGRR